MPSTKMYYIVILASLTEVLLARLEHKNIDLKENELYKYLVKTETWTRYELVMFNNSMFYFDAEALNKYFRQNKFNVTYDKKINLSNHDSGY